MQLCSAYDILSKFLTIYFWLMLAYALLSWFPSFRRYRWTDYLAMLVEPVVAPVRRIIPPVAGLDLSFLVVLILIQWVNGALVAPYACRFY
jgi:YggT family protein